MNKKTQMWLGIAALGVAAYLILNKSKKKSFVSRGKVVATSDCATAPEVVQDAGGTCSVVCENREGDLIYLQRPAPCPSPVSI